MKKLLRIIEIRSGGMLLFSLLLFFLDAQVLIGLLVNVAIHELGHLYMLRRYGAYIRKITVELTGLCIHSSNHMLSRRAMFLCAAAGPALGLCTAWVFALCGYVFHQEWLTLFAGIGTVLSLFNLLPVKPMDGWRMLHAAAPNFSRFIGCICSILIFIFGVYLMLEGYGTALAFLGIFFLLQLYG